MSGARQLTPRQSVIQAIVFKLGVVTIQPLIALILEYEHDSMYRACVRALRCFSLLNPIDLCVMHTNTCALIDSCSEHNSDGSKTVFDGCCFEAG